MSDSVNTPEKEQSFRELLARVDERTRAMAEDISELKGSVKQQAEHHQNHVTREELDARLAAMAAESAQVREEMRSQIKEVSETRATAESVTTIARNMVTKAAFWPVKAIVYAGAGMVLVGVMGALLLLVVRGYSGHPGP